MSRMLRALTFLAFPLALGARADGELVGDATRAAKVHALTLELSQAEAEQELKSADAGDQLLAIERALSDIYAGRCDEAAGILSRPDLSETEASEHVGNVARGCQRTMAGSVTLEDAASGTWIRFQDDADVVLAPYMFQVVAAMRPVFEQDLGVTMPHPLRVELVRDQHGLAAMTGLPLEAAQTTGTIGIAKWGRVIMVSPRATEKGYAYLDTLAHELTHLALTRASRDRAPLWLQEGVARAEEARWRGASPFDDRPSADAVAAYGDKQGIGPEIDKIGPSIALLPSALEAQITYAKVNSFMRFYGAKAGEDALPKLLAALKESRDPGALDALIQELTGATFAAWSTRWKSEALASAPALSEADRPGAPPPKELKQVQQRYRLGELLMARGHLPAAEKELALGHKALPRQAQVRGLYARALYRQGKSDSAKPLVESDQHVSGGDAGWWSLRAVLALGDVPLALTLAAAAAPYDVNVACEERWAPLLPEDAAKRALCLAARAKPADL